MVAPTMLFSVCSVGAGVLDRPFWYVRSFFVSSDDDPISFWRKRNGRKKTLSQTVRQGEIGMFLAPTAVSLLPLAQARWHVTKLTALPCWCVLMMAKTNNQNRDRRGDYQSPAFFYVDYGFSSIPSSQFIDTFNALDVAYTSKSNAIRL